MHSNIFSKKRDTVPMRIIKDPIPLTKSLINSFVCEPFKYSCRKVEFMEINLNI